MKIRGSIAVVVLAMSMLVISVGTDALPADAAGGGCAWAYRDTNGNNPNRNFRVSRSSPCSDLNAKRPTVSQHYLGQYRSNGKWKSGSQGWVYMSAGSNRNRVLINQVRNGANVRVTGSVRNARLLVGT